MDPVIETLVRVIQDNASSAAYGIELINAVLEKATDLLREHAQFIGVRPDAKVEVKAAHGLVLGHAISAEAVKGQVDPPRIFGLTPGV